MPLARRSTGFRGAPGQGLVIFVFSLLACGTEPSERSSACDLPTVREDAFGVSQDAITWGSKSSQIGLSPAERNAVVMVEVSDGAEDEGVVCSGVLVAEGWVLTARHCFEHVAAPTATVSFGDSELEPRFATGSVNVLLHPSADVAAIELEATPALSLAAPLRVLSALDRVSTLGVAVIAGFGVTRDLSLGARAFAAVDVISVDEQYFVTSGAPFSGACIGDSGGPLLARERDGAPAVLGLLSHGSGSCRDLDHFTRLDTTRDFLKLVPEPTPNPDLGCDGLGPPGACFSPTLALWCEGSHLRRDECVEGQVCGWNERVGGYRCLQSGTDPCAGVPSFGACSDSIARRCAEGTLVQEDCARCGLECARDPTNGRVGCSAVASDR